MTREEFIALVKGEQEGLRRFLLALCLGNRDEADDIAQDTLVKAYLSCAGYQDFCLRDESKGKFTAWLYTIAHRTFLDHKKTSRTTEPLEALERATDHSFDADSGFRYQELYAALATLPPKERTSILLFYLKGYSIREISKIIECSEDAVKKQLSRGREQLRNMIKR